MQKEGKVEQFMVLEVTLVVQDKIDQQTLDTVQMVEMTHQDTQVVLVEVV